MFFVASIARANLALDCSRVMGPWGVPLDTRPLETKTVGELSVKIRSQLADVDFEVGSFEYKRDHLIIHSAASQSLQSKVYVSPDDILSVAGKALTTPMVWAYLLGFPYFLIKYRLRKKKRAAGNNAANPGRG